MFHIDVNIVDQQILFFIKKNFEFFVDVDKNEYTNVMLRIKSIIKHVNEHFFEIAYIE